MDAQRPRVTRLNYCQYLLSSQINYTLTNFADHAEHFRHDALTRYVVGHRIQPRLVRENVRTHLVCTDDAYVVFDDTVLDKRHATKIALVRPQYSGNAKGIIKGIGVVTCVYVNPTTDQFWIIDYRLYEPEGDGKSKLDHMHDMLPNGVYQTQLPFHAVLMDTWYATKDLMLTLEGLQKVYYCPLKANRQVDDSGGTQPYRRMDSLIWSDADQAHGKTVKLKSFPNEHKVKLFRVVLATERTDYVVTNDLAQDDTAATQEACGWRWKIEQFHREGKQVTGVTGGQYRRVCSVRNHIGCAFLVWVRLRRWPTRRRKRFITSNMGCCPTICVNNSNLLPSKWSLRKSCLR